MFDPRREAVVCEHCIRVLVYPATEDDYQEAPYWKPSGETFCSEGCLCTWMSDREQSWRDFISAQPPERRGDQMDEDDEFNEESVG